MRLIWVRTSQSHRHNQRECIGTGEYLQGFDQNPYGAVAKTFLGPLAQIGENIARGAQVYDKTKDPYLAAEQFAPRFVKAGMKAFRAQTDNAILNADYANIMQDPKSKNLIR